MPKTPCDPTEIRGVIPPLVTPFREDETIDEAAMRQQLRYMLGKGVHGIIVRGSAGRASPLRATNWLGRPGH
jgi:4-hydroxy-tetrahydrodipicolinate synthase